MINFKLIYKILGSLLLIEATMLLLCIVMSFYYKEDDSLAFIVSLILTVVMAIGLKYLGREAVNSMGRRDAYLLVTLTWVIFSIFGAFPFIISGYLTNYTDAFFETMSGFTTTGASILNDIEALPHALLLWRSMLQWIGGLGIVFFTIAILPSLVGGSVRVFSAEATGPIRSKLHPRLSMTAKSIWIIYLFLTVGCAVCFYIAGMDPFDCLNYAMTVSATGGFAPHNDSTAYFHSTAIDYITIVFMFLAGVNFTMMYMALFRGKIKDLFKDTELRFYILLVVMATAGILFFLIRDMSLNLADSLRYALFEVVSLITTTGMFNTDAGQWPNITWIILCVCMFFGACAGSTSGGFKCIRGLMLFRIVRNEFNRIIHPRAILPVRVKGGNVPYQAQVTLLVFLCIYMVLTILAFLVLACFGISPSNAFTIALSCSSNVGPAFGPDIGPTASWSLLPVAAKWICSILMLMGRLEFFSVLVLFTPAFWKEN
ncbi:MAG: TrkH family potassium uptake protein [Prevotella sp.]|nr:TrkH family potassium uptake protein [Prevotella sp.]